MPPYLSKWRLFVSKWRLFVSKWRLFVSKWRLFSSIWLVFFPRPYGWSVAGFHKKIQKKQVASDAITPICHSRNRTIPIRHCFTDLFLISCPSFLLIFTITAVFDTSGGRRRCQPFFTSSPRLPTVGQLFFLSLIIYQQYLASCSL